MNKGYNCCIFFAVIFIFLRCNSKDEVVISGKILNSNPQTIYISRFYLDGKPEKVIDSISIKQLDSDFSKSIPNTDFEISLLKLNVDRNAIFIFLDHAAGAKHLVLNMTNLREYTIRAGQIEKDFARHHFITKKFSDSLFILNNFYLNDKAIHTRDSFSKLIQRISSDWHRLNINFAADSTNEPKVSLKIALETDFTSDLEGFKYLIKRLENKYPSDSLVLNYVRKGKSYIFLMENSFEIGDSIPNTKLQAYTWDTIDFYKFSKRKNVLVFWASYSAKSIELLTQLAKSAVDENTQIFTLSLDPDSSSYSMIVKQLPPHWIHFYDFNSWHGKLAHHFLIKEIPTLLQLDSVHILESINSDFKFDFKK